MFRGKSKPAKKMTSMIGVETEITGDVRFSGGLFVDGLVKGDVLAVGDGVSTLVISERARVEGGIEVAHLVVNGEIRGTVRATHTLELQAKAKVSGDVYYKALEMHAGAVVDGQLVYTDDSQPDKAKAKSTKPEIAPPPAGLKTALD